MSEKLYEMEKVWQSFQLITDIFLNAYLKTLGFKLQGTKKYRNRINFLFPKSPELTQAITDYYNRNGKVVALDYAEHFRTLRAFLHQQMEMDIPEVR